MKKWLIIVPLIFVTQIGQSQQLRWTSFDTLNDSLRKEKRPLLIFIHAEWCKYCRMQENTTFKDKEVVRHLNNMYYVLRIDGESKASVSFLNRTYNYSTTSEYHELAEILGKQEGKLAFPTTVILDSQMQLKKRFPGYLDKKIWLSFDILAGQ